MHNLRFVAERVEGLNQFIDVASEYKLLQGVILDINPIWLTAYRLRQAGLDPNFLNRLPFGPDCFPNAILETLLAPGPNLDQYVDFDWNSDVVENWHYATFGRSFDKNSPFLVKAITFPMSGPLDGETRYALLQLVRQSPFPAILETRAPARLILSAGDRCDPKSGGYGTIGGFLSDQRTGTVYAATCGHVVTCGGVSVHGALIGQCMHGQAPTALTVGQTCNRTCASMTRLDFALIDIGNASVSNTVSSIAAMITPTEAVTLSGATTGASSYEIGGACMVYKIGGACWDNLFEIRPPSGAGILSPRVSALIATVPKPGDSGAWVERAISHDWCGVLVASDHAAAYAIEAETVIAEANSAFGTDLALV